MFGIVAENKITLTQLILYHRHIKCCSNLIKKDNEKSIPIRDKARQLTALPARNATAEPQHTNNYIDKINKIRVPLKKGRKILDCSSQPLI